MNAKKCEAVKFFSKPIPKHHFRRWERLSWKFYVKYLFFSWKNLKLKLLRQIITHGSLTWCSSSMSQIHSLNVLQNIHITHKNLDTLSRRILEENSRSKLRSGYPLCRIHTTSQPSKDRFPSAFYQFAGK